jgi:hemolysin activation/secretion protein
MPRRWLGRSGLLITAAIILVPPAAAQVPPGALPPSVEPGRLQEQFQTAPSPRAAPEISVPAAPENTIPKGADEVRLQLDSIETAGATVYPPDALAQLTQAYVKRPIALTDLFRLADAITAKYRADGYILSRAIVPAQRIGTVARIVIVEGFVSEVRLEGLEDRRLLAYGDLIMQSRPLRAADLERYMLLANDLPGVTARAVLSPSDKVEGGATLTILASQKQFDGSLAIDNRGTQFIGPYQVYGGLGANLPWADERIAARYITSPKFRELQYGELTFTQPLGADGLRLVLFGSESWSRPSFTLSPFNARSYGGTYSATLAYPVIRGRDENLELRGGVNALDLQTVLLGQPELPPSSDDHLRILQAGFSYDRGDEWQGVNLAALQANQGVAALGASAENRLNPSRPNARDDFTRFTGEISRQQDLALLWPGLGFLVAATAQLSAAGALPSSQQFGLGGPLYGRAYDPSDITGDQGWAGKTEIQYTDAPQSWLDSYQLYAFFDMGHVWRNVATAGSHQLASAGFGVRVAVAGHVTGDLQLAKPLTRDESVLLTQPDARPWRVFFTLSSHF